MRAATLYREIEAFIEAHAGADDVRSGPVHGLLDRIRDEIVAEALEPRPRPSRAKTKAKEGDDGAAT